MIPFGPWHPDKRAVGAPIVLDARNCAPAVGGFRPMPSPSPVSTALDDTCVGAITVLDEDGDTEVFAGTATKLYRYQAAGTWEDVSRTSGGIYHSGNGERWQFGMAGALLIAVTIGDVPQKLTLGSSTDFTALGGSPPQARYIGTVRDFVVLGGLEANERTIHWCGIGQPEYWTVGTQSCDTQTFQSGGPVRGVVGGETGFIFQAEQIQRMTFVPGSEAIFQFDAIEGGHGLAAPHSLVRVGSDVYYLATDGFYRFNLLSAQSEPIGIGKWSRTWQEISQPGLEATVIGGLDPVNKLILWTFTRRGSTGTGANQVLIYDWSLDEATVADLSLEMVSQTASTGVTIDTMNSFGTIDTLPFSLDSPVWRGGAPVLGVFGTDHKLAYMAGASLAASIETADGMSGRRELIRGTRPHIETRQAMVAIAARETEADPIAYAAPEAMETTGNVPAWASGFVARARITTPAGTTWQKMAGLDTDTGARGRR